MKRATTLRSWWSERTVVPPIPETPRPHAGKKDTRRWCKGKVGVEHQKEWKPDNKYPFKEASPRMDYRCTSCGKRFSYCTGWFNECICGVHQKK